MRTFYSATFICVLLLVSCGKSHAPISRLSATVGNFDWDQTHLLIDDFARRNSFQRDSAWDFSDRVYESKKTIHALYRRKDGLAFLITNFGNGHCLDIAFYDWFKKDLNETATSEMLIEELQENLDITTVHKEVAGCNSQEKSN